ncbi:hypothetical protein BC832DRAFT_344753 [Gaertneriomyces semiglobifer]|nr:hypothetical protein BC832DRAFT_344753 [Gaertneriomyces semiglobifer]
MLSVEGFAFPRIKWDEDNIMYTEAQKSSTMKITEPKTPYIRYDSFSDMVLGSSASVPPIELEAAMLEADTRTPVSLSDSESESVRRRRVSVSGSEWDSEDEEHMNPEEKAKHDHFASLRSQHYNMRDALKKGRKLASKVTSLGTDEIADDADDEPDDSDIVDDNDMDTDLGNDKQPLDGSSGNLDKMAKLSLDKAAH